METNILHRKERLIITTIQIMDELGIQGVSTREIAKREGVSEATIFRHFKNKNELLAEVLDYFKKFDNDIFTTIKIKGLAPRDAMIYLFTVFAEYYENYPAITSVFQMFDVFRYEAGLAEMVKFIFESRICMLRQLIEDAKAAGEMNPDINSERLAVALSGSFREICLKWRFCGRTFSLRDETLDTLKPLLDMTSK